MNALLPQDDRADMTVSSPAPEMSPAEISETALRMAASIDAWLQQGEDGLSDEAIQILLASLVTLYAAKVEAGSKIPPLNPYTHGVTATDIMVTASGLLKVGNLQVFELGMWQSYTGR